MLLRANVLRAGLVAVVAALVLGGVEGTGFYAAGLAVFSVNRFILAALSASLPHTVDQPSLVSANAVSTTSGSVATVVGGGAALGLLQVVGAGDMGYAGVALAAALPYLGAAAVVAGFGRAYLGPDHMRAVLSVRDVLPRHGLRRPARVGAPAGRGGPAGDRAAPPRLRLPHPDDAAAVPEHVRGGRRPVPRRPGRPGRGRRRGAVGTLLAAAVTPWVVRHIGKPRWVTWLLAVGGVAQAALFLPFVPQTVVAAGLVMGFVSQAVKICVDTTLQESVDDDFRGRVFSVYDTLFNVTYVVALLVGAFVLPPSGISYGTLLVVIVGYLLTALAYSRITRRH